MLSLIAYTNTLSAAPGETIAVKVGSYGARTYRADLRRIIQGDRHPDAPGYKDEAIALDLGGERVARHQAIRAGSYVQIADRGNVLAELTSFTLAVPVLPTLIGDTERTIFHLTGIGLELLIDAEGRAGAKLGDARLTLAAPLAVKQWTLLILSFDNGELCLSALTRESEVIAAGKTSAALNRNAPVAVMIAARAPGENHFDGKIDSPVLFSRALEPLEAVARMALPQNLSRLPDLVAFWDFSRSIDGTEGDRRFAASASWPDGAMPGARHDRLALGRAMPGLAADPGALFGDPFPCRRHDGCRVANRFRSDVAEEPQERPLCHPPRA